MNSIGPPKPPSRPHVAVLGGAKGGSGRSTLCAEIARSLGRQGHRVLCVDGSLSCPTLNIFLGSPPPTPPPLSTPRLGEPGAHLAAFIHDTVHRNVWLASLGASRAYPFLRPPFQANVVMEQIYELDFDWVLVDLGPELDPFYIGLFALCEIPLLVCTPEPSSVRMATQFLRSTLYQAIAYHPEAAGSAQDEVVRWLHDQPISLNQDSLFGAEPQDPLIARILDSTLDSLEVYLLVNLVREGAEQDLGFVLSHAWFQELGIFPRYLGPIHHEDRRWFYNRRTTGNGSGGRQDEALSNDIEKLVRHLTQLDQVDRDSPRPLPSGQQDATVASALGLGPGLSTSQVRQHCRRLWEGYRREAIVSLAFEDPAERERMAEAIENLYRGSLSLPGEPSLPPVAPPTPLPSEPSHVATAASGRAGRGQDEEDDDQVQDTGPLATGSPGALITQLRKQQQLSLQELSQRTHIGLKYLCAIEDVDLDVLPRTVYLRGYLREIARSFELEPEPLVREYLRRLDQWRSHHG